MQCNQNLLDLSFISNFDLICRSYQQFNKNIQS